MTIERPAPDVKPKRRYDRRSRQEQADAARQRIIVAAERAFLGRGYASTTIAGIAAEAGVSLDSVYKGFGGKPGLVRAIYDEALRGRDAVPAELRSEQVQTREADPEAIMRAWGSFVAELTPRAAPLSLLARDAAVTDPELRPLLREIEESRMVRMRANAGRLRSAGHLRPGVSLEHAALVMWTYTAPELYELVVLRGGMSLQDYGAFVAQALGAALV